MTVNYAAALRAAERAADCAKDGSVEIAGTVYALTFNRYHCEYRVMDGENLVVSFNTRSINTAKRWLREWLAA